MVDAFVEGLDLHGLGFDRAEPAETGRPGYHPEVLLKLYVYGYLNRVQSSRRLEREAGRNVEVMWLTGRLAPDHKTIADFRKDNGPAISKVCSQFVELCRRIGLLSVASVTIDGSKFEAVNNRDKNFTKAKMARLKVLEGEMLESSDEQISLTDPDVRSMATSGRGSGGVGYNVQAAVETDHHLIVAHDTVQTGSDRAQLVPMGQKVLGAKELAVVANPWLLQRRSNQGLC